MSVVYGLVAANFILPTCIWNLKIIDNLEFHINHMKSKKTKKTHTHTQYSQEFHNFQEIHFEKPQ